MKKLINGCHFVDIHRMPKFQIADPKLAIIKKYKNGCHFTNICHTAQFQNYWFPLPPKFWVSGFLSVNGSKQNIGIGHYEKIENWLPFHKYASYSKISSYQTFQFTTQVTYV